MTRRDFAQSALLSAAAVSVSRAAGTPVYKMGIVISTSLPAAGPPGVGGRGRGPRLGTIGFLEQVHELGAGGIQSPISGDIPRLRARAEELGMYIEAMVTVPRDGDLAGFERRIREAKEAGAVAMRAAMLGGRRYETFDTLADWKEFVSTSQAAIKAVVPIVEKCRIPLAIENHKDWTADQLFDMLRGYSSEYVGTCFDFGNNVALLDDPMEMVETLAPYILSTHVKDVAVEPYADGFLLSEVPLGDGYLDLPWIAGVIRSRRPGTRFSLDMITRDPLQVPVMTDKYWVTFPERRRVFVARISRVEAYKSPKPLPYPANMSLEERNKLIQSNVAACLRYGKEKMAL